MRRILDFSLKEALGLLALPPGAQRKDSLLG